MPNLEWINHAGFEISCGNVRLLSDPWLSGSILNNSWDLLVPSTKSSEDLGECTHLWFSHEHPDHFVPPTLREFPEERRSKITALFKDTKDKKVVGYCRKLGFQVIEMQPGEWLQLGPNFRVLLGEVPFYDSWLLMEFDGKRVLNLNDCVLNTAEKVNQVLNAAGGDIDLLICQFGYANWVANPGEKELMLEASAEKLKRLSLADAAFKPKQLLLSASYVWFSHEENFYLNQGVRPISEVADFCTQHLDAEPVVLAPGQILDLDDVSQIDNSRALEVYSEAERDLPKRARHHTEIVQFEELESSCASYGSRIAKRNNMWLLRLLDAFGIYRTHLNIYLWDLKQVVSYSLIKGLTRSDLPEDQANVKMASDSLAFIFKFDFGFDSLEAGGRFHCAHNQRAKMYKAFGVAVLNNMGKNFGFRLIFDGFILRRVLEKLSSVQSTEPPRSPSPG